jgi:hypothetical protein
MMMMMMNNISTSRTSSILGRTRQISQGLKKKRENVAPLLLIIPLPLLLHHPPLLDPRVRTRCILFWNISTVESLAPSAAIKPITD